jgi:hypothetical protein
MELPMSRPDEAWLVTTRRNRRKQKRRRGIKSRAIWTWGTLPTPADPAPSNMVTKTYRDGTCDHRIPPATEKVISEYKLAIANWPQCAELRMEFAFSLLLAQMREMVIAHATVAAKLRPEWDWPKQFLSGKVPCDAESRADDGQ